MLSKWMQRLVFWSREKVLRAKFRLYEHFPFLFPHALEVGEEEECFPEDEEQEELIERNYQEHLAAEPVLEPRRTFLFSSYGGKSRCNILTANYYRKSIERSFQWAAERGFTAFLVDYTTPFGLLALETLLLLKNDGLTFNLYCIRSRYFGERKSYRLLPETDLEITLLAGQCDYVFSQYLPDESQAKFFPNVGALCNESGIVISSRWIPENLRKRW